MTKAINQLFGGKAVQAIMGLLLLMLFMPPIKWLFQSLHATEYRLHSILLIGFLIFLAIKNKQSWLRIQRFVASRIPVAVFIFGLIGFTLTEKLIDIDVISCVFMGITFYGLAGFIIDRRSWLNSAPLILLFILCLPLSYHIETFLGFPMRILSAKIAHSFFSLIGNNVQSTETILLIENKLANIDSPCSGIKSLWSITLFSLVLTIIEKYKINWVWFLTTIGSGVLVILANVFRIIMLVEIYNSNLPDVIKESLHSPVGLVGFIVVCIATYALLRQFGKTEYRETVQPSACFSKKAIALVFAAIILAISINQINFAEAMPSAQTSNGRMTEDSLPLSAKESDLFLRHGVMEYQKTRFQHHETGGTAFLILAKSWRGHHHPEQCLQGQGYLIESTKTFALNNAFNVRLVTLKNSDHAVIYWFQSLKDSTADYSSRAWSGLIHPETPYVMVSLYIENGRTIDPLNLKAISRSFYKQATAMLENGGKNEK